MHYLADGNTMHPDADDIVWLDPETKLLHWETIAEGVIARGTMAPTSRPSYNYPLQFADDVECLDSLVHLTTPLVVSGLNAMLSPA